MNRNMSWLCSSCTSFTKYNCWNWSFSTWRWRCTKKNKIYETDNLAGDELDIYKDDKYVGSGEAVVIDNDISAVRVVTKQDEIEERTDDDFYNTKVIFGSRIVKDDYKFDEGCILELAECISDPLKIIKDNKIIGYGELVILDESFAIKVIKVL